MPGAVCSGSGDEQGGDGDNSYSLSPAERKEREQWLLPGINTEKVFLISLAYFQF